MLATATGRPVIAAGQSAGTGLGAALLAGPVLAGYGDYLAGGSPGEIFERFNRFRILCALREGPFSVEALNEAVTAILARAGRLRPGRPWYEGRPVMVTRNDYGLRLFNGDVGIALADPDADGAIRVFFPSPDGSMRKFEPYRLPEHETVFAMTVHKSQGTEFDRVLFILPEVDARVLTREILNHGETAAALAAYEAERRPATTELVKLNRRNGPEQVMQLVEERAPDGFNVVTEVMTQQELEDVANTYKRVAGFQVDALNAKPPIVPRSAA